MNDRMKKRIMMFYFAGVINLFLGVYVVTAGRQFLEPGTLWVLILFFFGFAALDFYFPWAMKKKWNEEQARLVRERQSSGPA
jgi:hypothetical protein